MTLSLPPSRERGRDAWRQIQRLINITGAHRLAIDGVIGPRSLAAYSGLPAEAQLVVDAAVSARQLPRVGTVVSAPAVAPSASSPSRSAIIAKIRRFAEATGVSADMAVRICSAESNFNPSARAGSYKGLFQIATPAIADVARLASTFGVAYYPAPNDNVYDIDWNIMVGVTYMRVVARYLAARNIIVSTTSSDPAEWAKIYAAYNVGHVAARNAIQGTLTVRDRSLINNQASALRVGGPDSYLANVQSYLLGRRV